MENHRPRMTAGENPYAPPQSAAPGGCPDAPEPFGWEIDGKSVWVAKTSQLPMVDPFTGRSGETMMLQRVEVRFRPRWLLALPFSGGVLAMATERGGSGTDLAFLFLTGVFLGWMLSLFVGLFFPFCTLRVFFQKRTLRIRKNTERVMQVLFLLFLPGSFLFALGPEWLQGVPLVALVLWLLGTVGGLLIHRRLRCRRRQDGRFEIRGFHPQALLALAGKTARDGLETAR